MKVLVTGSSGLVGSALLPALVASGHEVLRAVRSPDAAGPGAVVWDPSGSTPPLTPGRSAASNPIDGLGAVVHLAGESIAQGRWTPEKKARIASSRALGTRSLAETLVRLERPPRILVSASAVGYYGSRGSERLDEASTPGSDFLAQVCLDWEQAAEPARSRGIRVVHTRFGFILSTRGGGLRKMLLPFRLGLGGKVGSGEQWMSWVGIDDVTGAIVHALATDRLSGPVNVTAPAPVTNREFTRALGRALGRPTLFPTPAFAARLAFGEMADALLLSSQRVAPTRLLESGFAFRHPELDGALRFVLGR